MTDAKPKILCIEDDKDTCELITFVFNDAGFEVETCSETDCLNLIQEDKFEAIILDNHFDGVSGVEICHQIRSFDQTIPVIFLSGETRQAEIEKARAAGANEYLIKPNDFENLLPITIKLIEQNPRASITSC
jgi:DNA-binding response OmpR family regulator